MKGTRIANGRSMLGTWCDFGTVTSACPSSSRLRAIGGVGDALGLVLVHAVRAVEDRHYVPVGLRLAGTPGGGAGDGALNPRSVAPAGGPSSALRPSAGLGAAQPVPVPLPVAAAQSGRAVGTSADCLARASWRRAAGLRPLRARWRSASAVSQVRRALPAVGRGLRGSHVWRRRLLGGRTGHVDHHRDNESERHDPCQDLGARATGCESQTRSRHRSALPATRTAILDARRQKVRHVGTPLVDAQSRDRKPGSVFDQSRSCSVAYL